jgi:hypothetical protein
MSTASLAAAKIYVKMQEVEAFHETFVCSNEPYRAVIDLARTTHMHNIIDGSEEYARLVDLLEELVCSEV